MYGCAARVAYLVLDEADKMLAAGLRPQLDRIRLLLHIGQEGRPRPQVRAPDSCVQNSGFSTVLKSPSSPQQSLCPHIPCGHHGIIRI
jgi:hypothetical protein